MYLSIMILLLYKYTSIGADAREGILLVIA